MMSKQLLLSIYFLSLVLAFIIVPILRTNQSNNPFINTAHLDSLYEEITVGENTFGIIHIYSEYPDYGWVNDPDEGIACVDDAARGAIFYLKFYKASGDEASLHKAKRLIEFLFYMHSDIGFFYNFIFEDYSINKDHENSINEPGWWSWRAMWALSEGYKVFKNIDHQFAELIFSHLSKAVSVTKLVIPNDKRFDVAVGIKFPTWLPGESASDQASLLILALLNYNEEKPDTVVLKYINQLCNGILQMQKGDSVSIPYCAFLSWRNLWHSYGNNQSYALLKTYQIIGRKDVLDAALNEINYFYEYLISENYPSNFSLRLSDNHLEITDKNKFSQIAYNLRPMIFACLEAFNVTGDTAYAIRAGKIASWFFGNNAAHQTMYIDSTGICYDGINSETDVNKNSGAESTIETLLSLQAIEENLTAKNGMFKIVSELNNK